MRKILTAVFLSAIVICLSVGFFSIEKEENKEYLRIHIRANSNSVLDQEVKLKVKDSVVDYLTPYIAEVKSKKQAEETLSSMMQKIESVAKGVLERNGFFYGVKGRVNNEEFPTRTYENVTLKSGYYDALILELGEGKGDNWWCVVYPPLCFVKSNTNYIYKSKIKEIIDRFFNDKGDL